MDDATHLQDQLMKMRMEAEERDAQRRAQTLGLSYLPPQKISINSEALELMPESQAREGQCAIIAVKDKKIAVIAYDPKYSQTNKILADLKTGGYSPIVYVVSLSSLKYALDFYRFVRKE